MRETDVLARLGGDEFAVILPRAPTRSEARLVADKLVETVRGHRAAFKGKGLRVTTSIGVARHLGRPGGRPRRS